MARPKLVAPTYQLHRPSGLAFVRVDGRFIYLGKHNSPESLEAYSRMVRECGAAGKAVAVQQVSGDVVTVAVVLAGFAKHMPPTYTLTDQGYSEFDAYRPVIRMVGKLYASTPAADFGPKALRVVRDEMLATGMSRNVVNRNIHRVKRIFKWAVGQELVAGDVYHRLQAVESLRPGQGRSTEPVKPVDLADVEATIRHCPRRIAAMVRLQLLTGMRSAELCAMRTTDVDTTGGGGGGNVWVYRPTKHKTQHHGHALAILIGPKAQAVLRPFLRTELSRPIFSPAEGEDERRAAATAARKTHPNQGNGPKPPGPRQRPPADTYNGRSYAKAIARAAKLAEVKHWHPHQLRHNRATEIRNAHGLDGAQVVLGHRTAAITAIYAELDSAKALKIVAELG